jgi:threonyl-tRNA synthetase
MDFKLPDGKILTLESGATGADAAAAIGPGLAKAALAIKVDGEIRDLGRPLPDNDSHGDPRLLEILTERSGEDALALIRHDAAHVMATAVMDLYPGVKVSIGPAIADGFYYDFDFPDGTRLSDADFERIEAEMKKHIDANEPFVREDVPAEEAKKRFQAEHQDYKVQLIDDLVNDQGAQTVSLYTNGPFTDLCRGPHAPSTKAIKAFKLQSVAGAYWRGDAHNKMLTRVYGTAFFTPQALKDHLARIEQAKARDHRKLGRELGLFMFSELAPGAPFWLPNGMVLWNELTKLWREENAARGYREVKTPILYDVELFQTSGHWDAYREHMYFTEVEGRTMGLKPMNCPAHVQLYKDERRSYRDLPVRFSEQGVLHRHEPGGTLHGLLRVRQITQDDAHIFCSEAQVPAEVNRCLDFGQAIYDRFGFVPRAELSTRPDKRIGSEEMWDRAEATLKTALKDRGADYQIAEGEGTFYGPKIDLHMTDSIGRSWQLGTVQLDYVMPERFGLTYTGQDNADHRPVMIHRALMGSFERFSGILIEHYAGEFPVWLAPVQAIVLPIADRHLDYARSVTERLAREGIRAQLDDRTESIARKIRDAELGKVPYMLVVGDREQAADEVALREHRAGDRGSVKVQAFADRVRQEIGARSPRD